MPAKERKLVDNTIEETDRERLEANKQGASGTASPAALREIRRQQQSLKATQ